MKWGIFILLMALFLATSPYSFAEKTNHMTLLAVKESPDGKLEGSTADLYIDVVAGNGRVFIETFPLTKLDTQISTRFAKEIACSYTKKDCDKYDFFYTIKSDAPIIGGPSAGAAIAVLTAAVLEGKEVKQDIAMTGTINSGGLIGPISGLRQKVEVAPGKGIKTVIIPAGQMMIKEMNLTWNLSEYALPLGANVTEANDIDEAVSIFTGSALKYKDKNISINNDYEKIMEFLAFDLCNRTKTIRDEISGFVLDNKTKEMNDKAVNLTKKAEESVKERKFYSAASYCFGANVQYGTIISSLSKKNADFNSSISTLNKMRENLESIPIKTMTDLETYMAVDERLSEAEESLGYAMEDYANKSDEWAYEYSYSVERAYSAESWSKFFGKPGKEFAFNEEVMKESCANKIAEAVERSQYVSLFAPEFTEIQDSIDKAQKYSAKGRYALCLHQSSKAKAEADALISLIGVEEDYLGTLVDNKLSAVKRMIAEQQETGIFPIVGYSYYEYANSLKDEDQSSALLYSEYALELSNLDMYFKEKSKSYLRFGFDSEKAIIFICGLIAGIIIGIIFRMRIKTLASTRRRLRGKKR